MSAYTQGKLTVETSFPILDSGKFKLILLFIASQGALTLPLFASADYKNG